MGGLGEKVWHREAEVHGGPVDVVVGVDEAWLVWYREAVGVDVVVNVAWLVHDESNVPFVSAMCFCYAVF